MHLNDPATTTPPLDGSLLALLANKAQSLLWAEKAASFEVSGFDIGIIPTVAFARHAKLKGMPNCDRVMVLTPLASARPSLVIGVRLQGGKLHQVIQIVQGDAFSAAEVKAWNDDLAVLAQLLGSIPTTEPKWGLDGGHRRAVLH